MIKKSEGNMYQGWVTHTKSYLCGECEHRCSFCYVQAMAKRFPTLKARYTGPITLDEKELAEPLGSGRTIFIEHMSDLFAEAVPPGIITAVLKRCGEFPGNTYVFQTKNPERYFEWLWLLPAKSILGTTIETNRWMPDIMSDAPPPVTRFNAMSDLPKGWKRFVTIEPVMALEVEVMVAWLLEIRPDFVNIGADSKRCGLPEPPAWKIRELIDRLEKAGIEVRQKPNLNRLLDQ